jgi:predicted XRE-type DNA-binding protein
MSKNVFLDLGFAEGEAREHAIRAEIAARIALWIEDHQLKQKDAARLFKVPQPTISKIASGNISNLSLGFFVRMLLRADLPFKICRGKSEERVEVSIDENDEARATFYSEVVVRRDPERAQFKIVQLERSNS